MKPGDKVKVVANNSMHEFNIGDTVTIIETRVTEIIGGAKAVIYRAEKDGKKFYIAKSDFNEEGS